MQLSALLKNICDLPAQADREVSSLILDSRKVQPGSLFFALKGSRLDGREFIHDALARQAAAILVEAEGARNTLVWQESVPLIPVRGLQSWLGVIAARFYGEPARSLRIIGVTGTSGKTSSTHLIAQAMQTLSVPCGLIGTLGSGFYGSLGEAGLTTPDAITLQAMLKQFVDHGAHAVAMEVSSHSIDQGRINGIDFDIGIFTNLSQDHLDYHGSMEAYAAVKKRFLTHFPVQNLIINADDALGRQWITELAPKRKVYSYSTRKAVGADVYAGQVKASLGGLKTEVHTRWGAGEVSLPLIGEFNLSNALAVLAALCVYGFSFEQAKKALATLQPVPGRMQTLGSYGKPLVVVDYAHKPDALEKVLQALRSHTRGKLICVFGCGGDRDRGKRPMMARIAEQLADQVIITNDNPRHEKPEDIAAEILSGFLHPERVFVELDRSKAIMNSIQCASGNDCILIAGKGAERYQQIGDEKYPFDDVEQAKECLKLRVEK